MLAGDARIQTCIVVGVNIKNGWEKPNENSTDTRTNHTAEELF